jgi:hypothetical protein
MACAVESRPLIGLLGCSCAEIAQCSQTVSMGAPATAAPTHFSTDLAATNDESARTTRVVSEGLRRIAHSSALAPLYGPLPGGTRVLGTVPDPSARGVAPRAGDSDIAAPMTERIRVVAARIQRDARVKFPLGPR